ncbi:MAG: tyrosine-type recombinase/integrase [Ginsengibacter sp.]
MTTYYARHSFATILKNSEVSTEFICEALGHSSLQTTKNYLAGFEQDAIKKTTDVLTSFKNNLKIA